MMSTEELAAFPWEPDPLVFIFNDDIPGKVRMHTKRLDLQNWIKVDKTYPEQMKLKLKLLAEQKDDVFVSNEDDLTQRAKWELFEMLIIYLPERFPNIFEKGPEYIYNKILGVSVSTSKHHHEDPLIRSSKLTQEDWVLLKWTDEKEEYILTAGVVCFPMRWVLKEKFQKGGIAAIHEPVKGFMKHVSKKVYGLLRSMQPQNPIWRGNWVVLNDLESPLDLHTPVNPKEINEPTQFKGYETGRELIFRAEYQTLRKLPRTQCIAFSLRTYQRYLEEFETFPTTDCEGLIKTIETMDEDFYEYKAAHLWKEAAVKYLKHVLSKRTEKPGFLKSCPWFTQAVCFSTGVLMTCFLIYRLRFKKL